jgi:AraC-like DNA-binding protein
VKEVYFPTLQELETSRSMIDVFAGYNHNLRIGESEFYDMKNLTSSHYPVLSPRERRGVYAIPENPIALISKDFLCYVDGSEFVINGFRVDMGLSAAPEDCPKQLVSLGAYVIILPDKKYINMALGKYIDDRILAEAERLLLNTNLSIKDISDKLGFCDQFYFCRKFTFYYGVSPIKHRQRNI